MTVRVLIVEDEPAIALEIASVLKQGGFAVCGLAASLEKGLALLERNGCDIALLDANLRGESVEPIALALERLGKPFLFVSGCGRDHLPEPFVNAPLVSKPFEPNDLIRAVRQLLCADRD